MNKNKPRNTSEYAEQIYDKKELSYVPKGEVVRLKKIITLVGTNNNVLDIGCYDGTLGKFLIKKKNRVYGIEINKEVANIARQRGLKVKIQDVRASRFKNF